MRFRSGFARAVALAATVALAAACARAATAPVTYVSGGTVYLDVGALAGLRVGDTLAVARAAGPWAALRVAYLSSHRAACDTLWTHGPVAVGDSATYAPHAAPAAPAAARAAARPGASARGTRLRGSVGARWLAVDTPTSAFRQPALDLRFDNAASGSDHVDVALDLRSRRTTRSFEGASLATEQVARVYRAAMSVHSVDAHWRMTLGRQSSSVLSTMNLFDGVLLEAASPRRTFGLFSGTQPDPLQFQFSHDIVQSGGYVEWHAPPQATRRWALATGGVTSQQQGQSNRDFVFAQGNWFSKGVSASAAQEVDVNTGWKRALGENVLVPTSTFASLRLALHDGIGLAGGFDNRRNVRLYRDRLTPETQFDDAYRQGAWVGGDLSWHSRVRVAGDVRGDAGAERSHAWSWTAEARPAVALRPSLRARVSDYTGPGVDSRLSSFGLGLDPGTRTHVDLSGGVRRTRTAFALDQLDREQWESADVDLGLGRRWYLNASWEHDHGGSAGETRQLQSGVNWRF